MILLVKKDEAADATLPAGNPPDWDRSAESRWLYAFDTSSVASPSQRTNVKAFTPVPGFRCKTAAAISAPDPGTAAFPPRQKRVWCEFQLVFFCDTKYDTFMQALIIEHKAASIIANSQ